MTHTLYPVGPDAPYGEATFGGRRHGPSLDDLRLVPPCLVPERLDDMARLGREPTALDATTATTIGGIPAAVPLVIPAMGSTPVAHRHGIDLARAAARAGVPLVIGENTATVWGYDVASDPEMPTCKDRIMAYLDAIPDGATGSAPGGIVLQQSVEDAMDELWHRVYEDPDVQAALDAGRVAFEVKVGQGAKPGLGGITLIDDATTTRLHGDYAVGAHSVGDTGKRERFSAPGTFTPDILRAQIRHLRNDFPKARIWVKLPATRDLTAAAHAVDEGGAHCITVDGAEGGTALAPTVFLSDVGLPLLAALARLRSDPPGIDVVAAGGLRHGGDVAKVLALGCIGAAMGRPSLQATIAGGEAGATTWFRDLGHELAMVTFALGHLDAMAIRDNDIMALTPHLADALSISDVLGESARDAQGAGAAATATNGASRVASASTPPTAPPVAR